MPVVVGEGEMLLLRHVVVYRVKQFRQHLPPSIRSHPASVDLRCSSHLDVPIFGLLVEDNFHGDPNTYATNFVWLPLATISLFLLMNLIEVNANVLPTT